MGVRVHTPCVLQLRFLSKAPVENQQKNRFNSFVQTLPSKRNQHIHLPSGPLNNTIQTREKTYYKRIFSMLIRFVWPKDDKHLRKRVVFAMSLLIVSKLLNVSVPVFFKAAVDLLKIPVGESLQTGLILAPMACIVGYGNH
jgi:hypothetical protein